MQGSLLTPTMAMTPQMGPPAGAMMGQQQQQQQHQQPQQQPGPSMGVNPFLDNPVRPPGMMPPTYANTQTSFSSAAQLQQQQMLQQQQLQQQRFPATPMFPQQYSQPPYPQGNYNGFQMAPMMAPMTTNQVKVPMAFHPFLCVFRLSVGHERKEYSV